MEQKFYFRLGELIALTTQVKISRGEVSFSIVNNNRIDNTGPVTSQNGTGKPCNQCSITNSPEMTTTLKSAKLAMPDDDSYLSSCPEEEVKETKITSRMVSRKTEPLLKGPEGESDSEVEVEGFQSINSTKFELETKDSTDSDITIIEEDSAPKWAFHLPQIL